MLQIEETIAPIFVAAAGDRRIDPTTKDEQEALRPNLRFRRVACCMPASILGTLEPRCVFFLFSTTHPCLQVACSAPSGWRAS